MALPNQLINWGEHRSYSRGLGPSPRDRHCFFLFAKFIRVALLIWCAIALPLFRSTFILQIAYQIFNFFFYLPLLFVRSPAAIITLASLGMSTQVIKMILKRVTPEDLEARSKDVVGACAYETSRERIAPYITATHIKHLIGRTAAFVVIVLGQVVPSVVYHTTRADVGFKSIYASAVSGLIIAFNFYWLYFDAECSHTFTPITFTNLHFPLCAYLILVSAATSRMAQRTEQVTLAIRW
ncbi:unnamed protein product [Rhizoctonia solani]|nr:unnamed protein product [Rhizoctonia solani]